MGRRSAWVLLAVLAGCGAAGTPAVQDGDIVFHTSRSSQSVAIQRATKSPYSHMGVVFYRGKRPHVFEAIATVRYTALESWIKRGVGGSFSAAIGPRRPTRVSGRTMGRERRTCGW